MDARGNRSRDRRRRARRRASNEEDTGGLDLPDGVDDPGPDHPVPQRHLRPGRPAPGSHRRRGGLLQPGRQPSPHRASGAVSSPMMILHHGWRSSASRRVRLCLEEKGLTYESHVVDMARLEHHSPEYLKINPNGVIPTLIHDGRPLHESGTICEYLDEAFPDPPLRPNAPYERALMRNWSGISTG